jgi:hypothetical protein
MNADDICRRCMIEELSKVVDNCGAQHIGYVTIAAIRLFNIGRCAIWFEPYLDINKSKPGHNLERGHAQCKYITEHAVIK